LARNKEGTDVKRGKEQRRYGHGVELRRLNRGGGVKWEWGQARKEDSTTVAGFVRERTRFTEMVLEKTSSTWGSHVGKAVVANDDIKSMDMCFRRKGSMWGPLGTEGKNVETQEREGGDRNKNETGRRAKTQVRAGQDGKWCPGGKMTQNKTSKGAKKIPTREKGEHHKAS